MPSGADTLPPACCVCWLVANRKLLSSVQINEGRLGSNQQLHREEGFYEYMKEHCPELKMWELNLYAKQPGEDASLLDDFLRRIRT